MATASIVLTRGIFLFNEKSFLVHVLSQIGVLMFVLLGLKKKNKIKINKTLFHRAMGPFRKFNKCCSRGYEINEFAYYAEL